MESSTFFYMVVLSTVVVEPLIGSALAVSRVSPSTPKICAIKVTASSLFSVLIAEVIPLTRAGPSSSSDLTPAI